MCYTYSLLYNEYTAHRVYSPSVIFYPFTFVNGFAPSRTRNCVKRDIICENRIRQVLIRQLTTGAKGEKIKYVHVYSNANMLMQLRNVYNNYN